MKPRNLFTSDKLIEYNPNDLNTQVEYIIYLDEEMMKNITKYKKDKDTFSENYVIGELNVNPEEYKYILYVGECFSTYGDTIRFYRPDLKANYSHQRFDIEKEDIRNKEIFQLRTDYEKDFALQKNALRNELVHGISEKILGSRAASIAITGYLGEDYDRIGKKDTNTILPIFPQNIEKILTTNPVSNYHDKKLENIQKFKQRWSKKLKPHSKYDEFNKKWFEKGKTRHKPELIRSNSLPNRKIEVKEDDLEEEKSDSLPKKNTLPRLTNTLPRLTNTFHRLKNLFSIWKNKNKSRVHITPGTGGIRRKHKKTNRRKKHKKTNLTNKRRR